MSKSTIKLLLITMLVSPLSSASDCTSDMPATLERARAVLRAYKCNQSSSLADCEMGMGVGIAALGAGAGVLGLGAKLAVSLRDPGWAVCPTVSYSIWMENAYAATAKCIDNLSWQKMRLNALNLKAQEKIVKNIDIQKKVIEASEKALNSTAQSIAAAEAQLKQNIADAESKLKSILPVSSKFEARKELYVDSFKKLSAEIERAIPNIDIKSPDDIHSSRVQDQWKNISAEQRAKIEDLYYKTTDLGSGATHQQLTNNLARETVQRELETAKKELESFHKLSGTITAEQKVTLQKDLGLMKRNLQLLESNNEAMIGLKGVLDSKMITNDVDLKESAKILDGMIGHDPHVALSLAETKGQVDKLLPSRTARLGQSASVLNKTLGNLKSGKIGRAAIGIVTTSAVNIGIMSGAHAAGLEDVAELLDPVGRWMAQNKVLCQGQFDKERNKLFIPTPENDCKVDFRINAFNAALIQGDLSELEAFVKQNPSEMCEFINQNYRRSYSEVKATCRPGGYQVTFKDGSRYQQNGSVISHFPFETTKKPQELQMDLFGDEASISRPQNSVSGTKSQAYNTVDLQKLQPSELDGQLYGFYGTNKPALAEVKACCSDSGMKPTGSECSRYGIRSAGSSGPSGLSQNPGPGTR